MAAPRPVPSVPAAVEAVATSAPDREILVSRRARLTGADLMSLVDRAATAMGSLGVGPGDRVAGCMGNQVELAVAFLATMRLGGIWVGLNRVLAPPELAWLLADSGALLLVGDDDAVARVGKRQHDCPDLRHLLRVDPDGGGDWSELLSGTPADPPAGPPRDPHAPAAIAYTSGTTGRPKGAVHSEYNMMVVATGAGGRTVPGPGDRIGVCLPIALLNLMILGPLASVANSATCVLVDRVDPAGLWEWVRAESIGSMSLVPTILHDLLTSPEIRPDELARSFRPTLGGSDCPPAWRRLFAEHGFRVAQNYGLTEAPTSVTVTSTEQPEGSSGRAWPHIEITIRDPESGGALPPGQTGEICIGPVGSGVHAGVYRTMLGYWHRPEDTARALAGGVLHTADAGWLDGDGWLFVADRRNDLIVRGGANVYPAEVERVLGADPRVRGSAVVGLPDDRLGQRVYAAVELQPPDSTAPGSAGAAEEELRRLCASELARYKVPDRVVVLEALPRTSMGKVRRQEAASLVAQALAAEGSSAGATERPPTRR